MNNNKFFKTLIVNLLFCNAALADVKIIDSEASPFEFTASLDLTDNINPTLDDEYTAYGTGFKPRGKLVTRGEGYQLMIDYGASFEQFKLSDDSTNFDFDKDQKFIAYRGALLSRFFIGESWTLDVDLAYSSEEQKFGTGISKLRENVLLADELTSDHAALSIIYGKDSSDRMLSIELTTNNFDYGNNNEYAEMFSYSQQALNLYMSFRRSSLSRWIARLESSQEDYDSLLRSDSRIYRALVGLNWQLSGKSALEILIGGYKRDNNGQDSNSGFSYLVDYNYTLDDNFNIAFSSGRTSVIAESESATNSIRTSVELEGNYIFSQMWQSKLRIGSVNTEFIEVLGSRELDERVAELSLNLSLKAYNNVVIKAGFRNVSSSDDTTDYQQQEVGLSWQYGF
jgi:hypothetical protein